MANNSSNPNELKLSVTAETSQAKKDFDTLRKGIEQLGKEFGRIKKTTASIQITEAINKAQNPLQKALSFLTKINKEVEKARDKLSFVQATDDKTAIEKAQANLFDLQRAQKNIYIGIRDALKSSGALHKQELQVNREITAEFRKQRRLKQDISGLKPASTQNAQQVLSGNITGTPLVRYDTQEDTSVKSAADSAQVFIEQYAKAEEALRNFELSLDPLKQKIVAAQQALQEARDRFVEFERAGDEKGIKQAEQDIARLTKELDKLSKNTNKSASGWSKLLGRIKNISIYRTIRTALRWLTTGIGEGLNNLAQYDSGINDTLSNLNASLNQIKNTMGIAFASVLQALTPLLISLANTIIDIVNAFNLAMAKMSGKNVYMKAKKLVDDYSKSLQKAQKFTFDTFEVLSGSAEAFDPDDNFEKVEISKDENVLSGIFEKVIQVIRSILGVLDALRPTLESLIDNILPPIGDALDTIASVIDMIADAIKTISKALGVDKPREERTWWQRLGSALLNPFEMLGEMTYWAKKLNSHRYSISGFASGGIPAKSEIFYMNENGRPEALVNTGGSQTNVINIAQLTEGIRQGFIQAIYDTGLNLLGGGQSVIQVDKDILGRTVAESSGFRNEVNRRNPALNLR